MSLTNLLLDIERSTVEAEAVDLEVLAGFDEAQEEGETDFVVELIDLYLLEAPRLFNVIREGLANDDWPSAKRAAHSLRGSSSNLGILPLAAIADNLEHCEATKQVSAGQLLHDLEDEFVRVERMLIAERQKRSS